MFNKHQHLHATATITTLSFKVTIGMLGYVVLCKVSVEAIVSAGWVCSETVCGNTSIFLWLPSAFCGFGESVSSETRRKEQRTY